MTGEAVEVVMPQMGESITEGTITVWHKQIGERVDEGEALLEISTAKVEVEIPSPASGVLAQVYYQDGETAQVDEVIALLLPEGAELPDAAPRKAVPKLAVEEKKDSAPAEKVLPLESETKSPPGYTLPRLNGSTRTEQEVERERRRLIKRRSSPLVRKMALEYGIDISNVQGTGIHGRVTARDFERYLKNRREMTAEEVKAASRGWDEAPEVDTTPIEPSPLPDVVPMSQMRRSIAEHLLRSIRSIPHAYTVHEIDFTRMEDLRKKYKDRFQDTYLLRLTPLVMLVKACAEALLRVPAINSAWRADHIECARTANIGIAVAVKDGLLVPVLKGVESMSLFEVSHGIATLAGKARSNQLKPEELQGGTFSISSPGQLGASFGIPIINQQQGAILHFGAIQKVPAVLTSEDGTDAIAIRQHAMLTLGIDHRLVDGWEADRFMSAVREKIEKADFDIPEEIR